MPDLDEKAITQIARHCGWGGGSFLAKKLGHLRFPLDWDVIGKGKLITNFILRIFVLEKRHMCLCVVNAKIFPKNSHHRPPPTIIGTSY